MSDTATTPLLQELGLPAPAGYGQTRDHPAFLRACHSPWRWLPQDSLCFVRGGILAYLIAVGILILDYKIEQDSDKTGWSLLFNFGTITYGLILAYHAIVFSWTYTHLYFPRIDDCRSGWEYAVLRAMSLPRNMASLRKQFYFTLLYFTTCVWAVTNTALYWFVTLPHNDAEDGTPPAPQPSGVGIAWAPADSPMHLREMQVQMTPTIDEMGPIGKTPFTDIFGEGWFKAFIYLNLFAVTTLIVFIEIFFLNSIKRPIAVGAHIFGLMFFSGLYLGWAAIGSVLTGVYPFFWLNEDEVGSREAVVANCIGFVALSPFVFSLIYGFIAIREAINKSAALSRIEQAAVRAANHDD